MWKKSFIILFFSLIIFSYSHAQLCTGSLGDPIINITFGAGANPGSSLSAATTAYQYVSGDCPSDGFYTVRNNTSACFGNSWHSLSADHTGDAGGYFMLVNASVQPGAFYLDTVKGLCGNTTYEFAAWIMNVLLPASCNSAGNQPNITFSIEKTDGTVLQSYNSGNIASASTPTWKQYGFFFTTPAAGSDIVLRMFNNAAGGCGNDLALDDITFRPCGPMITNTVNGLPAASQSFCEGPQSHQMILQCILSGGFINPAFLWQTRNPGSSSLWIDSPGATSNSLSYIIPANAAPGAYQVRLAVAEGGNLNSPQCRIYSTPFTFTINANPVTTAVNNGPACEGAATIFTATGGNQYAWTGPGSFTGTGSPLTLANTQFSDAGKYYVLVTNTAGCTHLDSTTISVNPAPVAAAGHTTEIICFKDSVQLNASGGLTYQWIPASGLTDAGIFNPKASPGITTNYDVVVANQFSCTDTASVSVNVIQPPTADAGPDRAILEGQSIELSGSTNAMGNIISWSPTTNIDDIHSLHPTVMPVTDTKYILTIVSNFGCGKATDTAFVKVYKNIYIPNTFTPNGDRKNDTWNIPALEAYPVFEVAVYSRWGQLVFHMKNTLKPWDGTFKGKPLPVGAYTYFVDVGPGQDLFKGTVLILR